MRQQIHDLKTKAKVFQDMKCSCCKMPLELPSVYFLCGCSYNQRCLVGLDREECIIHAEDRKKVLDVVDAQADYADRHEQFFKQLDAAQNRFGVVANYFGKGVFNKVRARAILARASECVCTRVEACAGKRCACGLRCVVCVRV
jgi:hypothetical protein